MIARRGAGALVLAFGPALAGCGLLSPAPAWERPPPPATVSPIIEHEKLHRGELDNGLEVLVLEDRRLPRLALGVAMRRGAGVVAPERAGLAEFTAELMKRGAGRRGALELAEAVDALGATLRVSSGWDDMTVTLSGLSRDEGELLDILADVALRPRFEDGEARKARGEMLAALEQAKDDPATLASWHLARVLYPRHPYGSPGGGLPETVAKLGARDARAFHREIFVPNNGILFAVGDVEMESFLVRGGETFGAWESGVVPEPGPEPPSETPLERTVVIVDRPDLAQARIVLGHEGIARTDPERVAVQVMNTILGGGGFSSRLMARLRSEEGLTYGVGSGFSLRRHPGPFYVSTFTRVPEVRAALDLTLAELARAQTDPPSEAELADAKSLMVGRFALSLETSAAVMSALVDLEVHGLPEDSLDTYRKRVRAVDPEDVEELAERLLHPERVAIVLVGPADEIGPQVQDLGPVEVVQP